jgi:hypothetical protein
VHDSKVLKTKEEGEYAVIPPTDIVKWEGAMKDRLDEMTKD